MLDQIVADFFGPSLSKYSVVICSEETFCHDHMPSRKFGMGGIDRSDISADILSRSGAAETQVVLSIRPQMDFLISTYTHFVHRHRESRDFKSWVEAEVDLPSLLWKPAVAEFQKKFGKHSVKTVSLSITGAGGISGYIKQMLISFGVNYPNLNLAIDTVHNPSPSRRAVELCRILNREIINSKRSEAVNSMIVDTFPVSEFGKFSASPWCLPAEIQKLYEQDHAEAFQ